MRPFIPSLMLSSFTVHADAHAVRSAPAPGECWGALFTTEESKIEGTKLRARTDP
jgi:hypothetical protein